MDSIRDNLRYDADSGGLVWARTRGFMRGGKPAGGMLNGSVYVTIDGVRYLAKNVVWYLVHGSWPKSRLYHKNGDRSDISVENLTHDRNRKKAASDVVDFGIRTGDFGYSVVKLTGAEAEVLDTYSGLDAALERLRGAILCSG